MNKAKVGDIICYHNKQLNILYFHKILEVYTEDYRTVCISGRTVTGLFEFDTPHTIMNNRLVKLLVD